MFLIDAHLDLSMNAINWNRDLELDVYEIRRREAHMTEKGRALGTVTLPELRKAEIGVCVATVIDRTARPNSPATGSACQEISYAKAQGQLAYYRVLEAQGKVRLIADGPALEQHMQQWRADPHQAPLGFILGMEGADPIAWPGQIHSWWEDGLRVVGPAHYGVSAYSHGTGTVGGLTDWGRVLLREMDDLGMILDLSHLSEPAFWEALELFQGPMLASHNNCRALVPGDRQFSDDQLKAIFQRDGVIGVACDAWMLYPGWIIGQTQPDVVGMEALADHLDHICQLAGNCRHVAVGSDLDGGYGTEQTPRDLDTIVDLQKLVPMLVGRGYALADVEAIMHGNWLRLFQTAWASG
jgi:membrane dipeptidase